MSTTDEELDKLFRDAAANAPTPEYKPEFFADIERQLPVKKARRSLAWWWTANLFLVAFLAWTSVEIFRMVIPVGNESLVGKTEHNGKIDFTSTKVENSATGNEMVLKSDKKNENLSNSADQKYSELTGELNEGTFHSVRNASSNGSNKAAKANLTADQELAVSNELVRKEELGSEIIKITALTEENSTAELDLQTRDLNTTFSDADLIAARLYGVNSLGRKSYFMELNCGLEQAWTRSEENPGSVNGNIGLNVGMNFRQGNLKYALGLGLNYTRFDDLKIKERSLIYGFGSNVLQNTYAFNGLMSVTTPIRVEYTLGRHALDLTLIPSINLITKVHRYQHMDEQQIVSRSGYSNVDLLNHLGFKPMIGYSYFVKENTQVGLRFGVQMLNPIQSDRFVGSAVKMPMEGQFYIRQTLHSRK